MKHIVLTDEVRALAKQYLDEIKKMKPSPVEKLEELSRGLRNNAYKQYVRQIIDYFDQIILCEPNAFFNLNNGAFVGVDLKKVNKVPIANGKKKKMKFFERIVEALQYDRIQAEKYPCYVNRLGIRSCVYCNAQYSVSAKRGKTDRGNVYRSTYTIDHYMAKSEYPYLAISFFNLYPCCSACNQTKSTKAPIWSLYCNENEEQNPFRFHLGNDSLTSYLLNTNKDDLEIQFVGKVANTQEADDYDKYFHIRKLYANFKEEAEEIVWHSQKYNPNWFESMKDAKLLDAISPADRNRFLIGNYDRPEDIHRRPLAKFTQDIARQLGII